MDRTRDITADVGTLGRGVQHHKATQVVGASTPQLSTGGANANIASEHDVIMAYRLILGRDSRHIGSAS